MSSGQSRFIDLHPAPADLVRLVQEGLARRPRQLPAWLLYDAEGSQLFEQICQQPEYSLTRTETALLEQQAPAMAQAMERAPAVVIEFGAGNARKVGPLLQALQPSCYAALDISSEHLRDACANLQRQHPAVAVLGVCCDYSTLAALPADPLLEHRPRLGFYPGSSLGNFTPAEAQALLRQMARLLGRDGQLLIGIDQPKAMARLEAAYNDSAGVSAAFARNLLVRLNSDLAGDFDPQAFDYQARWQAGDSRIAMALISRCDQVVNLAGAPWRFAKDEPLITEYSVKYSPGAFAQLAAAAGWSLQRSWSDPQGDLSLHLLRQADSAVAPEAHQP
ncbi:MAG: L-histidine N(alpha)-methyltransferase [Cyanobacteria bacterium K_DeepCast_35m_m2_155]|nr:L-histidine N(alpha)-methyltransferase [Cyanobacteria bacterium K_DeepCast_35m_m2_155]